MAMFERKVFLDACTCILAGEGLQGMQLLYPKAVSWYAINGEIAQTYGSEGHASYLIQTENHDRALQVKISPTPSLLTVRLH